MLNCVCSLLNISRNISGSFLEVSLGAVDISVTVADRNKTESQNSKQNHPTTVFCETSVRN